MIGWIKLFVLLENLNDSEKFNYAMETEEGWFFSNDLKEWFESAMGYEEGLEIHKKSQTGKAILYPIPTGKTD